ncbi:cilia- and flagella-associated protein 100-like [Chanos chanos]|uniref:Cilia- and flagella-associated protein 100-like n=1 Tax=Chanos chanos TaxID=29144 RepID=A0A6J2UUX0_CHACN|nr:cilia- and flagella-associated protein 100-like [Chanos chanos]
MAEADLLRDLRTNRMSRSLVSNLSKQEDEKKMPKQRRLQVQDKSTYSSRLRADCGAQRQELKRWLDKEAPCHTDSDFIGSIAWGVCKRESVHEQESIHEYQTRIQEMIRLNYSLAVKNMDMQDLKREAALRKKTMEKEMQSLECRAAQIDLNLKTQHQHLEKSQALAASEKRRRLEIEAKLNQIKDEMKELISEINIYKGMIEEQSTAQDFLFKVSPPEWQKTEQIRKEKWEMMKAAATEESESADGSNLTTRRNTIAEGPVPVMNPWRRRRLSLLQAPGGTKLPMIKVELKGNLSDYEEPHIYFSNPQQILEQLTELKQNIMLSCQQREEEEQTLERLNAALNDPCKEMIKMEEMNSILRDNIEKEKGKVAELMIKAQHFFHGEYKPEIQDPLLEKIKSKMVEVFRQCVGDCEDKLFTLHMLTMLEHLRDELEESFELIPTKYVEMAERACEREKRIRQREENLRLKIQQQDERRRKGLERAQADTKVRTGRRPRPRMLPPVKQQKVKADMEKHTMELDNLQYFS